MISVTIYCYAYEKRVPNNASIRHLQFNLVSTLKKEMDRVTSCKSLSTVTEEHILDTNAGKKIVLSCHRCLINTGVKKRTAFKYRLEFWPPDVFR